MAESEVDDERIAAVCSVLNEHQVDFVVIGGVAARLHDTGHATVDIDICPSSVEANLERLAAALRSIDTRLRVEGEPAGIPFDPRLPPGGRAAGLPPVPRPAPRRHDADDREVV